MPMEAQKEEKKQKGEDEQALAKKWLVKQHYFRMARTGRTYTDIKYELSVKYGLSVSSIEKLVYRKSKK